MNERPSARWQIAGTWLSVAWLGVGACAPGPAPTAVTPPAPATAPSTNAPQDAPSANVDALLPSARDVVARAMDALNADKFDCRPMESEKGVGACDVEKEGVPSIVLVYGEPVLFLLSHFLRKPGVACEQILPKVNEVNRMVDRLKLVCIDDRVTFMTALHVGSNGLTDRDLQEGAGWFRQSVQMVLATSGLVESLK